MRLIALISAYKENLEWLGELVWSLADAGCDHIVFCDGPYALYPDAAMHSSWSATAHTIAVSALSRGIGCTIHQPNQPWQGNEIHKRTFLFALGHLIAEPEKDWFVIADGDEVFETVELKPRLEDTEHDAAEMLVYEASPNSEQALNQVRTRKCFRAHRHGITVEGTHYRYIDGDRRLIWNAQGPADIDAKDLTSLRVRHRPAERASDRQAKRLAYYDMRVEERIEAHPLTMGQR